MVASRVSEILTIASRTGVYEVVFDDDALEHLDSDVAAETHFIIDERIAELYGDALENVLSAPSVLRLKAEEPAKSLECFPAYVEHLVERGMRRDHKLVAIGGGIIQDITCFLAATLLRGVEWHFYPTTLLAQADSCIGSKSSINCGDAKNILGTFTPPQRIHLSTRFLDTLDRTDVRSGVGEMLKVHAIDGPSSFDRIAADYQRMFLDKSVMINYIRRSLSIKKAYIEKDEYDRGPRNIFNYGHSFGHAIEAATEFAVPHGIAVTIGMDMANYIAAELGVGTADHRERMHAVLATNYCGFANHSVPLQKFMAAIGKDKKNVGASSVTLILPDAEGRVFKDTYPRDGTFEAACAEYLAKGRSV